MEYQILQATTAKKLAEMVKGYIAQGWRPQGGISGSTFTGVLQAMVREP